MVDSSYIKGSAVNFFKQITELLNTVSEKPLDRENNRRIRIPFFPLMWDLNQFYFLLKSLYRHKLFDNMAFIITDRKFSEVYEIFMFEFIETDEEEIGTADRRMTFRTVEFETAKHPEVIEKIANYLHNFDVGIFKYTEKIFAEKYNFRLGHLFIIPEHITYLGVLKDTDYINSDVIRYLKDFLGLLRRGLPEKGKIEPRYIPVLQYSSKSNRENPLVNLLIKFTRAWKEVDMNYFLDTLPKLLESLSLNIVVFDRGLPICTCRMNVESKIIHFNPVPMEFVKEFIVEAEPSDNVDKIISDAVTKLYKYTKTPTMALRMRELVKGLHRISEPDYPFAEAALDFIQYVCNCKVYPESLLARLLESFGLDCGKILGNLKKIIKKIINHYGKMLFFIIEREGTENQTEKKGEKYDVRNIFMISSDEKGQLHYRQIPPEPFKTVKLEGDIREKVPVIEEILEKQLRICCPFLSVIKMDDFIEMFSLRKIKSLIDIIGFMHHLPRLEKLAGLLINLSAGTDEFEKDMDEEAEETPGDRAEEVPTLAKLIEDMPAVREFLQDGLILRISGDRRIFFMENEESGGIKSLKLDLYTLKEFLKENFPNIFAKRSNK